MKSKNYSPLLSALLFEVALGMELNQKLFYPKVKLINRSHKIVDKATRLKRRKCNISKLKLNVNIK